jgi:hypothetical protein
LSIPCSRKHFQTPITHSSLYARTILINVIQVVASQDWPEVTKYAGLVCAQPHRQELIKDLFKCSKDPHHGIVYGGMIR